MRVTLYMRNGKEIDFETATFKVNERSSTTDKPTSLTYNMKDNGLSLVYVDLSEVIAITRDTRKDDAND